MLTAIKRVPLLRLLLPFLVGLVGCAFLVEIVEIQPEWMLYGCVVLAISILALVFLRRMRYSERWVFGLLLNVMFIGFGAATVLVHSSELFGHSLINDDGTEKEWLISIAEQPVEKARSVKLVVDAIDANNPELSGKALVYLERSDSALSLKTGDRLLIRSKLNPISTPGNPHEFNYPRYLRFHGIFRQAYVKTEQWVRLQKGSGFNFWQEMSKLRAVLLRQLDSRLFEDQQRAIIAALTLGDKQELDPETTRAVAGAGAMHVLAVSGLHVGILYTMIMMAFSFLSKVKNGDMIRAIIVVALLVSYAALTGMSASVFRAATMFSFVAWAKASKRYSNIYNTLTASAFVLLIVDPYLIMQVGFQLSYAAVLGIVFIHPWLFSKLVFKNRMLDWIWNITCVSIAAQITTFPLGLLYFHQFPNYFLFSNWVVIPLATMIMYAGMVFFGFGWIDPLTEPLAFVLKWLAKALNEFVQLVETLPFSMLQGIDISVFETIMIYGLIVSFLLLMMEQRFRWVYITIGSLVLLQVSQLKETYQQHSQQELIVYNIRKGFAMDLILGDEHIFLADQQLLNDKNAMLFHVEHHWWALGLSEPRVQTTDSDQEGMGMLFDWSGERVWIPSVNPQMLPSEPVHRIIICSTEPHNWKPILHRLKPNEIVVGQQMSYTHIKKLSSICTELGIELTKVRDTGPVIL